MLMCHCRHGSYIHQAERRIAGRLDPYELRLIWPNKSFDISNYAGRKVDCYTMCVCNLCEIAMGAAVNIGDGDDVGSLGEGLEDCSGGSGTGGESEGVFSMLEGRYCFFEVVPVRGIRHKAVSFVSSEAPAYLLGFELLTYSYAPIGFPTPV